MKFVTKAVGAIHELPPLQDVSQSKRIPNFTPGGYQNFIMSVCWGYDPKRLGKNGASELVSDENRFVSESLLASNFCRLSF